MQREFGQAMGKSLGERWKRGMAVWSFYTNEDMASLDTPINVVVRHPDVKAAAPMVHSLI